MNLSWNIISSFTAFTINNSYVLIHLFLDSLPPASHPPVDYEFYEERIGCFLLTPRTFKICHF